VGGCPTFRTASDRLERAKDFEGSGLTGAFSRLEIQQFGRFLLKKRVYPLVMTNIAIENGHL